VIGVLRPIAMTLRMPAIGVPSRCLPRTTGRRSIFSPRSALRLVGASAAPSISRSFLLGSRSLPSPSIRPGFSFPGRP
jgi:hypothetical protein